jgi:hypothetical protein
VRLDLGNFKGYLGQFRDPGMGRGNQCFEPLNVLFRNVRLAQVTEYLLLLFDDFPLFLGQVRALLADMDAVSFS